MSEKRKEAFTPGRWVLFDKCGIVEIQDGRGEAIVHWTGFDASGMTKPERKANARRIVRCVNAHDDLVAALQACVETFDAQEFTPAAVLQARAALIRARGEA